MKTSRSAANQCGSKSPLDWQRDFKRLLLGLVAACSGLLASDPAFAQSWTLTGAPVDFEWQSLACSADGSILTAAAYDNMPSSGNLLLSWQASSSAAGFVLQEESDLAMTNWVTVTNLPALTNGLNQVVIPLPLSGNQFYRLISPSSG
jgi:hypothetical protein